MATRVGIFASYWASAVLVAGLTLDTGAQAIPVISVGSATVNAGDTFTIPVSIKDAIDLQFFQFDLSYAPAIFSVLSFTDAGTDFEAAATAGEVFSRESRVLI